MEGPRVSASSPVFTTTDASARRRPERTHFPLTRRDARGPASGSAMPAPRPHSRRPLRGSGGAAPRPATEAPGRADRQVSRFSDFQVASPIDFLVPPAVVADSRPQGDHHAAVEQGPPQRGQRLRSIATEPFPNRAPNGAALGSGALALTTSRPAPQFTTLQSGRCTVKIDPHRTVA